MKKLIPQESLSGIVVKSEKEIQKIADIYNIDVSIKKEETPFEFYVKINSGKNVDCFVSEIKKRSRWVFVDIDMEDLKT